MGKNLAKPKTVKLSQSISHQITKENIIVKKNKKYCLHPDYCVSDLLTTVVSIVDVSFSWFDFTMGTHRIE